MGMGAACMYQGERTTARSYLVGAPANLTILLNATIAKVVFEGKVAKGVKCVDGREYFASKDVVLSAGVRLPQTFSSYEFETKEKLTFLGAQLSTASDALRCWSP
jgi:hypothetical protein